MCIHTYLCSPSRISIHFRHMAFHFLPFLLPFDPWECVCVCVWLSWTLNWTCFRFAGCALLDFIRPIAAGSMDHINLFQQMISTKRLQSRSLESFKVISLISTYVCVGRCALEHNFHYTLVICVIWKSVWIKKIEKFMDGCEIKNSIIFLKMPKSIQDVLFLLASLKSP